MSRRLINRNSTSISRDSAGSSLNDYSYIDYTAPPRNRSPSNNNNNNNSNNNKMTAYGHMPGQPVECLSIPVELRKEEIRDMSGSLAWRVGFRIGGGIDQDPTRAPYKYPDSGIYITHIDPDSPAERAGLRKHDKILQVNGNDFTMLTHDKAVKYIKQYPVLQLLITRANMPPISLH